VIRSTQGDGEAVIRDKGADSYEDKTKGLIHAQLVQRAQITQKHG
jgi:hypothetical protein